MSRSQFDSTAGLLRLASLGFDNALADDQILDCLTEYGFHEERLTRSRTLYQEAFDAAQAREAAAGAQLHYTSLMQESRIAALDSYQSLAKIARAVFLRQPSMLTTLEIQGHTPRASAAFLKRAYTLFDNASTMPDLQRVLAEHGYDSERIASERAHIEAFENADQLQEAAKGDAQQATILKRRALSRLRDEYLQFRKIARVALRENPQLLEKLGIQIKEQR